MRIPQLNLRDLFWLMLVAACLSSWFVERERLRTRVLESEAREGWRAAIKAVEEVTTKTGGFAAIDRNAKEAMP